MKGMGVSGLDPLLIKKAGATALIAINACLLVWAIIVYQRKKSMPWGYLQWLSASPAMAAFQVFMGIYLWLNTYKPPGMHVFYGIIIGVAATAQAVLTWTPLRHQYRGKPVIYGFLNLVVALVAVRSWMVG